VGRQDRNIAEMSSLGGTLNQGDSERGNSDYYPCETRGSNSTGIRIPSGMRQGFRDEKGKGGRACVFHRKKWNEEQVGNRVKERAESSGRKKLSLPCPCPFQEDVQFVISSMRGS